jgi:hypothetical protein
MSKGKDKCDFLRNIRRQVAAQYGLRYEPRECHHDGDCPGTCPVCDAELRDLQRQLTERGIENIDVFERVESEDTELFEKSQVPLYGPGIPADPEEDIHILEGDVTPPEDRLEGGTQLPPELEGMPRPPEDDDIIDDDEEDDDEDFGEPYRFCYVAGISFHNINDIWDELCIGAKLALVRQPDNKYDKNAIGVALVDDYNPEEPESFDFNLILGYIPRSENEELAAMMEEGYQVGAEITELNRHAPYNERLGITIIRYGKNPKPSNGYRALEIVTDDEISDIQKSLLTDGFIYQRWGFWHERRIALPIKGEKVVLMHKRENDTVLYLTTVGAVGDEAIPFVGLEKVDVVDDREAFILFNSVGPVVVPNWSLDFLDKEDIETMTPSEKFLSKSAQSKLAQIFTSAQK